MRFGSVADSTETSVPWSKIRNVINALNSLWKDEMSNDTMKIRRSDSFGFRISQIYHDGVCLYIYYLVVYNDNLTRGAKDDFLYLREKLIKTITNSGGSLSHHHGIGKKCKAKYLHFLSPVERKFLHAAKKELDPKNIFGNGNLIQEDQQEIMSKL